MKPGAADVQGSERSQSVGVEGEARSPSAIDQARKEIPTLGIDHTLWMVCFTPLIRFAMIVASYEAALLSLALGLGTESKTLKPVGAPWFTVSIRLGIGSQRVSLRTGMLASELWMPCAGSAEGEGGGDARGGQ